jgi:EPTP domain
MTIRLERLQRLPASGARAVEAFTVDDLDLLAVPQLAVDAPGTPAGMNGGDSNTELILFRRAGDGYEPWSSLTAPGGEDAEFFTISDRRFLAVASIRTGAGPYDYEAASTIYEWHDGKFLPGQLVRSFAAKQWKYWRIGERHFLGLAQGAALPGRQDRNRASMVYEWDGSAFAEFQLIPSRWAYNWHPFEIGPTTYVAHAEHLDASVLYRWDGQRLVRHQDLAERSGRAFANFAADGDQYLLAGCLQVPSWLMRWTGDRFEPVQRLDGLGTREFAAFRYGGRVFVVRVNFVLGTPAAPQPSLTSQLYEFRGGRLEVVAEFPTTGGTDVAVLESGGDVRIVVSNSLSAEITFASGVDVYRLLLE